MAEIIPKIVYVQVPMQEETLNRIKAITGETATKDAMHRVIEHFLSCEKVSKGDVARH